MGKIFKDIRKHTLRKGRKSKRNNQLTKTPPTTVSHRESENERANERMQQADINKEIDEIKKDVVDVREYMADEQTKKRLEEIIKELPRDDRSRNLLDNDDLNLKPRSSLNIKK